MYLAAKHGKCILKGIKKAFLWGKLQRITSNKIACIFHLYSCSKQPLNQRNMWGGKCFIYNYVILSHALKCYIALMFRSYFLNGHKFSLPNNTVRANQRIIPSICQQCLRLTCVSLVGGSSSHRTRCILDGCFCCECFMILQTTVL